MDSVSWSLPVTAEIGGGGYRLNTDYRDVLEIIGYLEHEPDKQAAAHIALALFFVDYDDMPPEHWAQAAQYLEGFLGCFEAETGRPQPKQFDWEQDYAMIVSGVNKVAHAEVRAMPYLHWFTFVSFFMEVGEGQFSTLVSVRQKLAKHKKLEKWEQEFYRNNKDRVKLKPKYTPEEQAEKDRWNMRLGR